MHDIFSVQGKAVLVTGGASGLGLAIAEGFAKRGARVAIADLNPETLGQQVDRLKADGLQVSGHQLDVANSTETESVFAEVATSYGGLDVLFANAGIDPGPGPTAPHSGSGQNPAGVIEAYSDDRWKSLIDISLNGVFYSIRAGMRHMRPRKSGSIIVTTSISAIRPTIAIGAAYMAAKAGAAQAMRGFALEAAADNVRINALAPGPFATNINDGAMKNAAKRAGMASAVPLGRVADPTEILGAALLLASDAGGFITGEQIVVDGGTSLSAARH